MREEKSVIGYNKNNFAVCITELRKKYIQNVKNLQLKLAFFVSTLLTQIQSLTRRGISSAYSEKQNSKDTMQNAEITNFLMGISE